MDKENMVCIPSGVSFIHKEQCNDVFKMDRTEIMMLSKISQTLREEERKE
jgi:hypothetical protein